MLRSKPLEKPLHVLQSGLLGQRVVAPSLTEGGKPSPLAFAIACVTSRLPPPGSGLPAVQPSQTGAGCSHGSRAAGPHGPPRPARALHRFLVRPVQLPVHRFRMQSLPWVVALEQASVFSA